MGLTIASAVYIIFLLVPVILGLFLIVTLWKISKSLESQSNSLKEIAESIKNNNYDSFNK
ncbi:hypothetical protein [Desulfotomaculum defluvii]